MVEGSDGGEGREVGDGAAVSVEDVIVQGQGHVSGNGHVTPPPDSPPFRDGPETELLADVVSTLQDRGRQYGPPSDHHRRTAAAVNAILGTDLGPREVALFFVIDKMVRARTSPGKRDHYEDMLGYTSIAWGHEGRGCE